MKIDKIRSVDRINSMRVMTHCVKSDFGKLFGKIAHGVSIHRGHSTLAMDVKNSELNRAMIHTYVWCRYIEMSPYDEDMNPWDALDFLKQYQKGV